VIGGKAQRHAARGEALIGVGAQGFVEAAFEDPVDHLAERRVVHTFIL
jgi:hypothetical protein